MNTNDYYDYLNQYSKPQNNVNLLIFVIVLISLIVCVSFGALASSEAKRQGRNNVAWFFLGFFFLINGFVALKVSKAADDEGHSINLWSTLGVIFGISAIIAFESGLNAENKLHDFDCWVIIGFVYGLIGLLASCCVKPYEKQKTTIKNTTNNTPTQKTDIGWICKNCNEVNSYSVPYCLKCGEKRK